MKKLFLISIILLFSCSSDETSSTINDNNLIVGRWKMTSVGWLVNGEETDMTEPETTPCNIPYNLEFLDTGLIQVYGCNPYSTPMEYTNYSGNWLIANNSGVKNLSLEFPSRPESNSIHKITLLNSQKLRTHILTYSGSIRVSHYQKVN